MEVTTSRFGTILVSNADVICFPNGLAGFEDCRNWVLLLERPGRAVGWLQSTQWPEVALPVVDPRRFVPDYTLQLAPVDWLPLGADRRDRIQLLVTVATHDAALTLNLMAPLAINQRRRLGRQVINNGSWPVDHIALDAPPALGKVA
jgi:flagellar assembly factor FliW